MSTERVLLAVIAGLLLGIAVLLGRLLRKQWNNTVEVNLANVDEVLDQITRAVQHHADVNAVVSMINALEQHPGALEQLQDYPETVRAAAWLHYINILGADLQKAQKELSNSHRLRSEYGSGYDAAVRVGQEIVDDIRNKLDAAIAASGQNVGPRAV